MKKTLRGIWVFCLVILIAVSVGVNVLLRDDVEDGPGRQQKPASYEEDFDAYDSDPFWDQ